MRVNTAVTSVICLCASLALVGGCGKSGGKGLTKGLMNSHEKAAREYFLQEWEKRFRLCGDTYYGYPTFEKVVYAVKTTPAEWEISPIPITKIDKENPIVWQCHLAVTASKSAVYHIEERAWHPWYEGTLALLPKRLSVPLVYHIIEKADSSHGFSVAEAYYKKEKLDFYELSFLSGLLPSIQPIEHCEDIPPR
ncbi:MAG: hypothetical protein PHI18_09690 [bacterium]|nr:hypothetical protein [bacterium]